MCFASVCMHFTSLRVIYTHFYVSCKCLHAFHKFTCDLHAFLCVLQVFGEVLTFSRRGEEEEEEGERPLLEAVRLRRRLKNLPYSTQILTRGTVGHQNLPPLEHKYSPF